MNDSEKSVFHALLRQMMMIREFEEAADKLTLRGKIPGGMHNSAGQEAVAVGVMAALAPEDIIATTHRSHHHTLAKGMPTKTVMAELFSKSTGCCGGRGASMHLADVPNGHYGGNGIVGAGVGIAMGAALGIHHQGDKKVAVGFVGDGGMNTGRTWESINMAVIWKLPLIVVVDNNQYAVETPSENVTGGKDLAKRAAGFGIPAFTINGQDVLEVKEFVTTARNRALQGDGPTFINAVTYRYSGHNVGEKGLYRTQEEISDWKTNRDPIDQFIIRLTENQLLSQSELEDLRSSVKQEILAAVEYAESSPDPDISTLMVGVDSGRLGMVRK
ncbi:MAG: thiamine pyrophosphate-dependent enzyme [Actinomycetes bacterium]